MFQWMGISAGKEFVVQPYDGMFPKKEYDPSSEDVRHGVAVDVETTGLSWQKHRVIEIGMRAFAYSRTTGEVFAVTDSYDALQDPGEPLPKKIREITGLTDADLAGKSIDTERVSHMISGANIVIAHNASFDRPFVDKLLGKRTQTVWACSIQQIAWDRHGLPSKKLEILAPFHGFYSTAHRAGADADTLVRLLDHRNALTGETYLFELLKHARTQWVLIEATGAPFETKDLLKERGYEWNATKKVWNRTLPDTERDFEVQWLEKEIYSGRSRATVTSVAMGDRFSAR